MPDLTPGVQPQISHLAPYQPGMPIEELARMHHLEPSTIIKLASNENPDGISPVTQQAILDAHSGISRYPDGFLLRQALSKHYTIDESAIVLGNGSNDVLDLIARVFLGPDTNAISSQFAFIVYDLVTRIVNAQNIIVSASDFGHDLHAMRAAITGQTRVVWIANPNNPTGTFLPYDQVEAFVAGVPKHVIVVLDEAYYEYLSPKNRVDTVQWLQKYPNLILVRTFSKIYGLAGLRIGYALASSEVANLLNRVRQPFNVNHLGIMAAAAALGDQTFVATSRARNLVGIRQLTQAFDELGLAFLPAYGNFVTVAFPDAAETHQALLKQGIIVRPLAEYGMPDHLRITVGTPSDNERLIASLHSIL